MTILAPRLRVSQRLCRNGRTFWVQGWEIFDPKALHSVTGTKGGRVPLTLKRPARLGQVHLISAGQNGRPFPVDASDVRPTRGNDTTFQEFCSL